MRRGCRFMLLKMKLFNWMLRGFVSFVWNPYSTSNILYISVYICASYIACIFTLRSHFQICASIILCIFPYFTHRVYFYTFRFLITRENSRSICKSVWTKFYLLWNVSSRKLRESCTMVLRLIRTCVQIHTAEHCFSFLPSTCCRTTSDLRGALVVRR